MRTNSEETAVLPGRPAPNGTAPCGTGCAELGGLRKPSAKEAGCMGFKKEYIPSAAPAILLFAPPYPYPNSGRRLVRSSKFVMIPALIPASLAAMWRFVLFHFDHAPQGAGAHEYLGAGS